MNTDHPEVLIIGAAGFIASRLKENFHCVLCDQKIFSYEDTERIWLQYKPKIVLNCVGHIGKDNVDDCEKDKSKNLLANTFVPIMLGELAIRHGFKLIHISSGCIYHVDYKNPIPIKEEALPDFLGLFYSRSKIYAEQSLSVLIPQANILIVRIRIPLDNRPYPKNILNKLIRYKKVIDVSNSVTYIPDFIQALKHLIQIDAKGIYNVVNEGGLHYPQLMNVYQKYVPDFRYELMPLKDLNLVRTNLILSTVKLQKSGFKVRPIAEVLEECVQGFVSYS